MDIDDLGHIRHDLKNLVTSLVSGCTLIEALSGPDASADLREILAEMRAELERGRATVDRLKAFEDGLRES